MNAVATTLFLVVGIVNALPVVGVVSAERLGSLYGVDVGDPNLAILMRHRAVLFSIVGGLLIYAAFAPELRSVGLVVGLVSMLSFVVLALGVGEYNAALRRLVVIDAIASVALVAAFWIGLSAGGPAPAD